MLLDATKDSPGIWNLLTLCGTLVAALIGSIGGKLWDASRERRSKRDALVIRYLSQLQTTIQMLESRLDNLTDHSGREVMSDEYYRFTTLYAIACPLALERIFLLDGIYAQINDFDKDLYCDLYKWSLDKHLRGFGFHRYNRVALAECAMERGDSGFRLATYFEFRDRYEKGVERNDEWLKVASSFSDRLPREEDREKVEAIVESIKRIGDQLAVRTGISRQHDGYDHPVSRNPAA